MRSELNMIEFIMENIGNILMVMFFCMAIPMLSGIAMWVLEKDIKSFIFAIKLSLVTGIGIPIIITPIMWYILG
jgi:hypothetical protein